MQVEGQDTEEPGNVRLTAWVDGHVQGVGFRWWTRSRALALGLVGTATNLMDGRVEVVAEGPEERVASLLDQLREPGLRSRPGRVDSVVHRYSEARGMKGGFHER